MKDHIPSTPGWLCPCRHLRPNGEGAPRLFLDPWEDPNKWNLLALGPTLYIGLNNDSSRLCFSNWISPARPSDVAYWRTQGPMVWHHLFDIWGGSGLGLWNLARNMRATGNVMDTRDIFGVDTGFYIGTPLGSLQRIHIFWLTRKFDRSSYEQFCNTTRFSSTAVMEYGSGQGTWHFLGTEFRNGIIRV